MKNTKILAYLLAAVLTGCTVVPTATVLQTCELLRTATNEAEMAPAWYVEAGAVLERCGIADARAKAEYRACYAERQNNSALKCEVQP